MTNDSGADAPQSSTFSEEDFLSDILSPHDALSLTPNKLLLLDESVLLNYSLLLSSLLNHFGTIVGHGDGTDSASNNEQTHQVASKRSSIVGQSHFLSLVKAFLERFTTSRPLKLRLALLLEVADLEGLESCWAATRVYDPDAYSHATKPTLTVVASTDISPTRVTKAPSTAPSIATVTAPDLLSSHDLLRSYAARRFFHPKSGIAFKTKRRYNILGLKTYKNSFSETNALLFLMQDLKVSDVKVASEVGQKMVDMDLIKRVDGASCAGSCRTKGKEAFGYSGGVYIRKSVDTGAHVADDSKKGTDAANTLPPINVPKSPASATGTGNGTHLRVHLPFELDAIDMQSIHFWSEGMFEKPLVEGKSFGFSQVVHPMIAVNDDHDDPVQNKASEGFSHGGAIIHQITAKKVFSSMAKPGIISCSRYSPGASLDQVDSGTAGNESIVEVEPRMISKTGDNLLQDLAISTSFRIFNYVWQTDSRFGTADRAPYSFAYDVLPTGNKRGVLEFMPGIKPLNDYDWKSWVDLYGKDEEVLDCMVRSAAGSSIACYVLGCGDRHFDNIQIRESKTLLHIDFGMILGENPPFKTPRFSISADMEKAFKEVDIWERFVSLCSEAFLSLRSRSAELMHLIALVLEHTGKPRAKILKYLASEPSFNIANENSEAVVKFVTDQVRASSTQWSTIARKFTHDKVDPLFFKAAEAAPKAVVQAVEKMYDK